MEASVVADLIELTTCLKCDWTGSTMSTNLLAGSSVLTELNWTEGKSRKAETGQLETLQQKGPVGKVVCSMRKSMVSVINNNVG